MSEIKVVKPAFKHGVKVFYYRIHAVSPRDLLVLHLILSSNAFRLFLSDPTPTCLKPVAKKFKTLTDYQTIAHMGFVWVQGQPFVINPFEQPPKRIELLLRFGRE